MKPPQHWLCTFRPYFRVNSHIRSWFSSLKASASCSRLPLLEETGTAKRAGALQQLTRAVISLADEEKGSWEREVAGEAEAAFGVLPLSFSILFENYFCHTVR